MNLKRLIRLADAKRLRDGFWKPYYAAPSLYKSEYRDKEYNSGVKSFGVDFDTTLEWVRKKNPNMSTEEQERFAQNIINKKKREREELEKGVEKNREGMRKASENMYRDMESVFDVPYNYTGD